MTQEPAQYDRPAFFNEYMKLPRQVHGHSGASEWPVLREIVGSVTDLTILDLGCGLGWFSRYAVSSGARRVTGMDNSTNMITRAREMTTSSYSDASASSEGLSTEELQSKITYRVQDLDTVDLENGIYDLVYSSLTLHYLSDESYSRLLAEIYRALKPGGSFVFSIEHPIYTAPSNPTLKVQDDGSVVWPLDRYAVEGVRHSEWLGGVTKFHRTLETYLMGLLGAGFRLDVFREWMARRKDVEVDEQTRREFARPMFALVGVVKGG